MPVMQLKKRFSFEASHFLPALPENHKCRRLHGHRFEVAVTLEGPVAPDTGWVMDFAEVHRIVSPHVLELDHSLLNDIPGLENPTSENIAVWLWNRLKDRLELLDAVEIRESPNSACIYRGPEKD
jgi:6-pyruvoyltetrahydropterin/6-carboxytetrahydropterin synthase